MKTQYIQPQVQVTDIQCVTVIAASGGFTIFSDTETSTTW